MKRNCNGVSIALLLLLAGPGIAAGSSTLVLNDPAYPLFHASSIDQPVLDVFLTDPQNNGEVFRDDDPYWGEDAPVIFRAFVDTGASGFVISHLLATGLYDVPALYLNENDYIGTYTELGIGGPEEGNVSRPLGVHVLNGARHMGWEGNMDEFSAYGDFNLWVRQEEGFGETADAAGFVVVDPVNIVGMPVIRQGIMVMDASNMQGDDLEYLHTYLLPPASPEPEYNFTLALILQDFVGDEKPPGETFPSHTVNPAFPAVTVSHTVPGEETASATGQWLFDTGAGSSFVTFAHARQINLIPDHYPDLDAYMADHQDAGGNIATIGGIGRELVTVPILQLDEIRIPTKEGFDVAWRNVNVLIMEIEELAELGIGGIFGMNLLLPSVTMDGNDPENLEPLNDVSPGVFRTMTFDPTDEANAELRLFTYRLAGSYSSWGESYFSAAELEDPTASGPEADPDQDGIPNLLEYALGSLPKSPSRAGLPTTGLMEEGGRFYLTLTYERIKPAGDIEFVVESSPDLVSWSPEGTEVVDLADLGNRERVTVRAIRPVDLAAGGFLRLRVTFAGE